MICDICSQEVDYVPDECPDGQYRCDDCLAEYILSPEYPNDIKAEQENLRINEEADYLEDGKLWK